MAAVDPRSKKKTDQIKRIVYKEETRAHAKKVSAILKKNVDNRTKEECAILDDSDAVIALINKRATVKEQNKQRHIEIEDDVSLLKEKCVLLTTAIKHARSLVVYTGAGISTAASIPDYRGPNGVWTLLKQGKRLEEGIELSKAHPTVTHLCLTQLFYQGLVKHVVSQNCDGLHMRSGLPGAVLSELHGNMYIEVCKHCMPMRQYPRLFDVTERTGIRRHKTGRLCHECVGQLEDTIVHFGEKGGHESPYNWQQAADAADKADVVLCLGTSLKVLRKYPCLWGMHKPASQRPLLYIVNLQWTPKDDGAALKINGKCDDVMRLVAENLGLVIPSYSLDMDPLFSLSVPLASDEGGTTSKLVLLPPSSYNYDKVKHLLEKYATRRLCRQNTRHGADARRAGNVVKPSETGTRRDSGILQNATSPLQNEISKGLSDTFETIQTSLQTPSMHHTSRSLNDEAQSCVNNNDTTAVSNPLLYNVLLAGAIEPAIMFDVLRNQDYIAAWLNQLQSLVLPGFDYFQSCMLNFFEQRRNFEELLSRRTSFQLFNDSLSNARMFHDFSPGGLVTNDYYSELQPLSVDTVLRELCWKTPPKSVVSCPNHLSKDITRQTRTSTVTNDCDAGSVESEVNCLVSCTDLKIAGLDRSSSMGNKTVSATRASSRRVTRSERAKLFWASRKSCESQTVSVRIPSEKQNEGTKKRKRHSASNNDDVKASVVEMSTVMCDTNGSITIAAASADETSSSCPAAASCFDKAEENSKNCLPLLTSTLSILASRPGWFGKGICIRKFKKRKSK